MPFKEQLERLENAKENATFLGAVVGPSAAHFGSWAASVWADVAVEQMEKMNRKK
jgi:hypothetical protein